MPNPPFGARGDKIALGLDRRAEHGERGFSSFQVDGQEPFVPQEGGDVRRDGGDQIAAHGQPISRGLVNDASMIGRGQRSKPLRPSGGVRPRHRLWVAEQVDVKGIAPERVVEPAEHPRQAVIRLDVAGRIGKTVRSEETGAGLVTGGVVGEVAASGDEGSRPATSRAEHEYVHGRRASIASSWMSPSMNRP